MNYQLEQSAIEAIKSLQRPGKPDILARIINMYLEKSPTLIADIKEGIAANDTDRVKLAAHTLRSSSAYLGASKLADQCTKLERKAANNQLSRVGSHVKSITDGYEAVCEQIRQYG